VQTTAIDYNYWIENYLLTIIKSHNNHTIESLIESETDNEFRGYRCVYSEHTKMNDRGRGLDIR
jgi:hypothetical protein